MVDGIFTLGPFGIPRLLVLFILSAAAAHLLLFLLLRGDRERFRGGADLFSTVVIIFFIAWRISIILTHWPSVKDNPPALLYLPGGFLNALAGSIVSGLYIAVRYIKKKIATPVLLSFLLLSGLTVLFAVPVHFGVMIMDKDDPLRETPSGNGIVLQDINGNETELTVSGIERTIVNFWATWCPPCRAELPEFSRYNASHDPEKVRIIAVNLTSTEKSTEAVLNFTRDRKLEFPVLLDTGGRAAEAYGINSVPTTMVFDIDGTLVDMRTGAVDYNWLMTAGIPRTESP